MIYGAYGYSGRLVAELARELGLTPVLAGRDAVKVRELADELECEHRVFDLVDPQEIAAQIEDIDCVIHCAGPFSATSARPSAANCRATGWSRVHSTSIS